MSLRLRVAAACAALLAGCTGAPEPRPLDGSGPAAVAAVSEVADAQVDADRALAEALDGLRAGDEAVRRARAAASVDAALAEVDDVRARLEELDLEAAGTALEELTGATARAQAAVARAAADAEGTDAWLSSYLEAELAVLAAVDAHVAAGDDLRVAIAGHRDVLLDALDVLAEVAGRRGDLRDAEEAAAAVEVALRDTLEDLIDAQEATAAAGAARATSGEALNEASADAAAVAERRPPR